MIEFEAISQPDRRQLDEQGYVVLPDFMPGELLASLREQVDRLFELEGEAAGAEFKQEAGARRLANLVNKGDVFQHTFADRRLLAYVAHVLGDEFKVSSVNARSADPRGDTPQPLHCDMGALPDERGNWVCNSVWMLDDFTTDNGALRAVPGSHRGGKLPGEELDDLLAPHPDEVLLTGTAGTVIVMNAHLWHGGLANTTDQPRRAVHAFFCRRDKPQQQYQKQLLEAGVQSRLTPDIRWLLALDDPQNDQLSAEVATRSGFLR